MVQRAQQSSQESDWTIPGYCEEQQRQFSSQSETFSKIMNHRRNLLERSAAGARVGKPLRTSPCSPADAVLCCGMRWGQVCINVLTRAGRVSWFNPIPAETRTARSQSSLSQVGSHSFVFPSDGFSVFPNSSISYCGYTIRHHPERMVQDFFKKGLFVKMLLWQVHFVGNLGSS